MPVARRSRQEWASVGAGMSFELGHAADVDGFKAETR